MTTIRKLLLSFLIAAAPASHAEVVWENPKPGPLTSAGQLYKDTEAKVQFTLPGLGWLLFKGFQEDTFEMRVVRPIPTTRSILFSAEPLVDEFHMDVDSIAETMLTRFDTAFPDFEPLEQTRGEHLGMPYVRQDVKFRDMDGRYLGACIVLVSGSSLVQLHVFSRTPTFGFDGFVQESIERIAWMEADPGKPRGIVKVARGKWTSPKFGYTVNLLTGALLRPDLAGEADLYALSIESFPLFAAAGGRIGEDELTPEQLAWSLLPKLCAMEAIEDLTIKRFSKWLTEESYDLHWADKREPRTLHRARLIRSGANALILSVGLPANAERVERRLQDYMEYFTLPTDLGALAGTTELRRENATAMNYLGLQFTREADFISATKWFSRARDEFPDDIVFHTNLAFSWSEQGRHEEALSTLDAIPAGLERTPIYHLRRARALQSMERTEEAATAYGKAVDAGLNDTDAIDSYAHLLASMGRADEAIKLLLRFEAESDNPIFPFYRASVMEDAGRLEEALALLRERHSQAPGKAPFTNGLGWMLFRAGKTEEAIQVAETLPDDEEFSYTRGMLLAEGWLRLGNLDKARANLHKALSQSGENNRTSDLRKRIEEAATTVPNP